MAGEPVLTVVGNLTDDPELRFTQSGRAVCSFTVASTPRRRQGEEWVDGDTLFQRCNLWGPAAENLAGSDAIRRGTRVLVSGRLRQRNWEKDGQKRSTFELEVDELGASIQFAMVMKIEKTGRSGSGGRRDEPPPVSDDPWASTPSGGGSGSGGGDDEPPW